MCLSLVKIAQQKAFTTILAATSFGGVRKHKPEWGLRAWKLLGERQFHDARTLALNQLMRAAVLPFDPSEAETIQDLRPAY